MAQSALLSINKPLYSPRREKPPPASATFFLSLNPSSSTVNRQRSTVNMPPKKSVHEDPPDMHIALNLKYGIHTFVVLADPLAPFSNVTSELWFALRDRLDKDQGLKAAHDEPPRPLPPVGKDVRIAYAVLKDTRNTSKGWKDLDIQGDETPVSKGLKNNATVAFVICDVNDDEEPVPEFVVQWPRLEEDSEEEDDTELRGGAEAVDEDDGMDS